MMKIELILIGHQFYFWKQVQLDFRKKNKSNKNKVILMQRADFHLMNY